MFSKSLNYSSGSYPPNLYANNQAFPSDIVSFPTLSPYSFANQPSYAYAPSFQPSQFQNFHQSPNRINNNNQKQSKTLQDKSFIDGFDNNASALHINQKSHARNIKGRLFNPEDPTVEKAKQDKQLSYRQQLQRQIEQTKRRKQDEKQKIQKQEMDREKKFYQQFKIKAHTKDEKYQKSNNQNGYFMIRTFHKFKKSKNDSVDTNSPRKQTAVNPNPPVKGRGKTYQNKSSLDNWELPQKNGKQLQNSKVIQSYESSPKLDRRLSRLEEEIVKQRSTEEDRLSKLLLFQQRVLQKINDIKTQIRSTSIDIDSDKQLQRIRNNLRAKPIPFQDQIFRSGAKRTNFDANHFYSLPQRQIVKPPATRYSVKLKDLGKQPTKSIKSEIVEVINDKNQVLKQQKQQQIQ